MYHKEDYKLDQVCISICVRAIEKLSDHYAEENSCDSVAIGQAKIAKERVIQYLIKLMLDS